MQLLAVGEEERSEVGNQGVVVRRVVEGQSEDVRPAVPPPRGRLRLGDETTDERWF